MKRLHGILVLALLTLVLSASDTFAQLPGIAFGARVGRNWKSKDQFVGGQVEASFSSFTIAPNIEYYLGLPSGIKTHYDINIDGQYTLFSLVVAKIFVGGGYVIDNVKVTGLSSKSTSGFDVQAGAKMNLLFLHPFGLVKWTKVKDAKSLNVVIGANVGF